MYTIAQVMDILKCKRGTVESFRKQLVSEGVIVPHSSLEPEHLAMLQSALKEFKTSSLSLKSIISDKIKKNAPEKLNLDVRTRLPKYLDSKIDEVINLSLTDINSDKETRDYHFLFETFRESAESLLPFPKLKPSELEMFKFDLEGNTYRVVLINDSLTYIFCKLEGKAENVMNYEFIMTILIKEPFLLKLRLKHLEGEERK